MKRRTRRMRSNAVEVAFGDALEWGIQRWVAWSGREARIAEAPWLEGPIGNKYTCAEFYEGYAKEVGLDAVTDDEDARLLPSFDALAGEGFDPSLVQPGITDFYERTARYGRRRRSSARRIVRTAPSRSSQMAGASGKRATTGFTARKAACCA